MDERRLSLHHTANPQENLEIRTQYARSRDHGCEGDAPEERSEEARAWPAPKKQRDPMFRRIECVVAELLTKGNVVAPVDVLVGMGLLRPEHLDNWRRGRVPYLERVINCNLTRLSRLLRVLRFHAHDLNLKPSADVIQTLRQRPQAAAAFQQNRRSRPRGGLRDAFRMAGQAAVLLGANRAGATD